LNRDQDYLALAFEGARELLRAQFPDIDLRILIRKDNPAAS
jgi:hypothetical protein